MQLHTHMITAHTFRIKSTNLPSSFNTGYVAKCLKDILNGMEIEYGRSHVYEPHQRTGYKSEIKIFLRGEDSVVRNAVQSIRRAFDHDEHYDEFTQTKIKFGSNPLHWPVYIPLN